MPVRSELLGDDGWKFLKSVRHTARRFLQLVHGGVAGGWAPSESRTMIKLG
jgi:hypothetical protein